MRTINTFKQGHAFLIKCLQKHSEPMGGEGRGGEGGLSLDQPMKGTSVMNQRKKKRGIKNWARRREKKNEKKRS